MSSSEESRLTHHGRPSNNVRAPVRRNRSNSVRRLHRDVLDSMASGDASASEADKLLAQRELSVRQTMERVSDHQARTGDIGAVRGASASAVDGLRLSQSLAEEAVHGGGVRAPGILGVAEVGDSIGVSFSGQPDDFTHSGAPVMARMQALSAQYESSGQADSWSGTLVPVAAPTLASTREDNTVCAAERASVAASGSLGISGRKTRDALLEVDKGSFGAAGKSVSKGIKKFRVDTTAMPEGRTGIKGSMAASRPRSQSVGKMLNSCSSCRTEHAYASSHK